ncbi:MAG: hypothetical protein Q7U98_20360 [Methylicorpusculum sp.]|uniref:hypothetical protein n=1 Tax=Methylicorpusculum sp. TaxID=2713644 RepID=UPI0027209BA3|nr:hypothetical protein [Methylicorpusculum sp.]MDO8941519.1 hypothetical protein [Methylicorpusculum sp.]
MNLTKEFKQKFHTELRDRCVRMVEQLDTVTPGDDFHADFDMEFNCLQLELAAKWMFKCLTNDPSEEEDEE